MLCFRLHFTKNSTTNNTASATVRQLVSAVFERVQAEDAALADGQWRFCTCDLVWTGRIGLPGAYSRAEIFLEKNIWG